MSWEQGVGGGPTCEGRVGYVALRDEELRVQLLQFRLQLAQLRVGLLHDVVHVGHGFLIFGNFPQVLGSLLDLKPGQNCY